MLEAKISPYVVPGDPTSGVLARISTEPPGEFGAGDNRLQAYCFRIDPKPAPRCRASARDQKLSLAPSWMRRAGSELSTRPKFGLVLTPAAFG